MLRLPAFVLAVLLSTGWGSDFVRATATALGLYTPTAAEDSVPPPPPEDPTTQSGCSWDPLGCPEGG